MSVSPALVSLRIPELGPSLGKLVTGSGRMPGGIALDDVRVQLVTRIFQAAGESRRLSGSGEPRAALEAVGPSVWQPAWNQAVASVATRVVERVNAYLEAEGRAARMSKRRRRQFGFREGDPHTETLVARLGAHGAPLIPALDALEAQAIRALTRSGIDHGELERWQDALRLVGRRLEAAWLSLEQAVDDEVGEWRRRGDDIARWRRPLWPVTVVGVVAIGFATWFGLVLGGYLASPHWLTVVWSALFK